MSLITGFVIFAAGSVAVVTQFKEVKAAYRLATLVYGESLLTMLEQLYYMVFF